MPGSENQKVPSLASDVAEFNKYIELRSYVHDGHEASKEDFDKLQELQGRVPDMIKFPHAFRWCNHISSLQKMQPLKWAAVQVGTTNNNIAKARKNENQQENRTNENQEKRKNEKRQNGTDAAQIEGKNEDQGKRQKGTDAAQIEGKLPFAEMGKVCTRFPPEPSGYMHIGHAKAAMLNHIFAKMYEGKLIIRFDDTNPSKEKLEFQEAILEDCKMLGIVPDQVTHTSDYFDFLQEEMRKLIAAGDAYVDDAPQEQMSKERFDGIESKCRLTQTTEQNLARFEEMLQGTKEGQTYCVRAKMDMKNPNKCLRDPVFFRCKVDIPHHRTGTKYKAYPTYDWACPIVDAKEGISHTLRTIEYKDREPMYNWVQDKVNIGKSHIYEFSKTQFNYTVLSKRKLTWFVENKIVDGWNDPRFPTVKGILRRGLTVEALRDFMKTQGASKRDVYMEWDKLWVLNRQIIDPKAVRYAAVTDEAKVLVFIKGLPASSYCSLTNAHPKNAELGKKVLWHADQVFLDQGDAKDIAEGEQITLIHWGNVICEKITKSPKGIVTQIEASENLAGNVKDTKKKLHWVAKSEWTTPIILREYDHLVTKAKFEEGDQFEDFLNPETVFDTRALAEPAVKNLAKGTVVQLERIGFFIVDSPAFPLDESPVLIKIPEGKTKAMSNIKGKVDAAKLIGASGAQKSEPAPAGPAASAADMKALEHAKAQVAALKAQGAATEALDLAVAEMKRLKELCGEKELSKSERKKLEKAQKAGVNPAQQPAAPPAAQALAAATGPRPEDQKALDAIKEKVRVLKTEGVAKEQIDAALAEMKRLKEVCGEKELSKSERKKLEKTQKKA